VHVLLIVTGLAELKFNKVLIKIILKIKVRAHSGDYYKNKNKNRY
jgi:hypothetical protein